MLLAEHRMLLAKEVKWENTSESKNHKDSIKYLLRINISSLKKWDALIHLSFRNTSLSVVILSFHYIIVQFTSFLFHFTLFHLMQQGIPLSERQQARFHKKKSQFEIFLKSSNLCDLTGLNLSWGRIWGKSQFEILYETGPWSV